MLPREAYRPWRPRPLLQRQRCRAPRGRWPEGSRRASGRACLRASPPPRLLSEERFGLAYPALAASGAAAAATPLGSQRRPGPPQAAGAAAAAKVWASRTLLWQRPAGPRAKGAPASARSACAQRPYKLVWGLHYFLDRLKYF